MRPIIIALLLALGSSAASAQYLPLMGPNGPIDISAAKPRPANAPLDRALADNPDFACPVQVSCIEANSPNDTTGDIIVEMDVKTTVR